MNQNEFIYGYYFAQSSDYGDVEGNIEVDVSTEIKSEPIKSLASFDKTKPHWLHFDYTQSAAQEWLTNESQLNPIVVNALLHEEARPRATALNDGVLLSLRGVNLAPNSDPEDMVSIRIWFTKNNIVSTRRRTLLSTKDIASDFDEHNGPKTPAEFVVLITERLISRMSNTIYEIEEKVAEIEENILTTSSYSLRNELSDLRRQIISLRRYLSPQREAMLQLMNDKLALFTNDQKIQLRETTDHLIHYIEDLDSVKDRAVVCQEELNNSLNEQMNNRMFVLSIVAAVFLPLGFLTGLLGINVGGIPGAENEHAFMIFILILIVVVIAQVFVFKKKRWF